MLQNKEVIRQVREIYKWLDEQLIAQNTLAVVCDACGKCCDFESFGHRLFVTTPEILYFADKVGIQNIKQMTCHGVGDVRVNPDIDQPGRCSYQIDNKCSVYDYRFAACRIFFCKGNADFQSDLTETAVKKFKMLCEEFQIPYRYVDLPTALNNFSPPHT
jgi:Fe-S-cluster containining protein